MNRQSYILEDIINQQNGIIGRGTHVIGATSGQGVAAVVKFSWPTSCRVPESDFIEQAWGHILEDEDENNIGNNLPKILDHEVDKHWMKSGSNCEPQQLHIVVFCKLTPVTQLTNTKDLAEAIRGIFKCSCSLFIAWGSD